MFDSEGLSPKQQVNRGKECHVNSRANVKK
jgi:hypothetical protein